MLYRVLFAILILISIHQLSAQTITIKNGDKSKTFPPETYYNISFSDGDRVSAYTTVEGTLQRVYADSVQFKVDKLELENHDLDFSLNSFGNIDEKDQFMTFPKAQLEYIQAFKSQKQSNRKSTWNGIGAALLFTGLVTLANSYDLDDKSWRNGVLISGGAQIGLGIITLSIARKKAYLAEDGWYF